MRLSPSLCAALALATAAATAVATAAAGTGERSRAGDRVPKAVPTGPARSCIPISAIRDSLVRSDRVIDFTTGGDKAYRVVLPQDCPELGFERRFAYETSLSELCSTDIITVVRESPVSRGASCGLSPFQPVTLPRRR